jgi:CheY-like chemotaxis protein
VSGGAAGLPPLILVVEDDPDVSEAMVALLEEAGYRVLPALDGAAGLRLLRERPEVALILLDLTMPRMSASQFRSEQRRDGAVAGVPVVLMSAGLEVGKQAELLGALAYVCKPFRAEALLEVVARLIAPASGARAV